jgi:serine phosphatase RsbU (regulator of sigma subunit)/tetratricopeptide (TPR) repeat protein
MVKYKVKYFFITIALCFLSAQFLVAQTEADSLKRLLAKSKLDTTRLQILNALIELSPDGVWEKYNEQLGKESEQLLKSNNSKIKNCALGFKATYINNCGFIAHHNGDIQTAINSYNQSLKINEQINHLTGIALAYNNIGFEYSVQNDLDMALKYYKKAYEYYDKANFEEGRGLGLNNIAHIQDIKLRAMNERKAPCDSILALIPNVLENYMKSLRIHEKLGEMHGMENGYNNIGSLYGLMIGQWKRCGIKQDSIKYYTEIELEFLNKGLKTATEFGDSKLVSSSLNNLGWHYYNTGDLKTAEEYAVRSYKIAKEMKFPGSIRDASRLLYFIYKNTGNSKAALVMHEEFINLRDSVQNDKNRKLGLQKQLQYEYDKKAAADSVKVAAEREIIAAELKQEKTQKIALYGGLALMIVFALFIFNRFKKSQAQSKIIAHQKEIVDEKQKEILDSIIYAKRIQAAMLTSETYISKYVNDYFIYYQPKDIVSGDFYWAVNHVGKFFFVTADCTGHGVPGAFMSLLNISFLNENIIEKNIIEPARILNEQRNSIIKALNTDSAVESKDGMDCILCAFDFANLKLEYAAANNDFYIIREGQLLEFKADKMPVGKSPRESESFTSHTIDLQKGDMVYTLTDGLADQFGGPKGKKFKYKQLEEILISISTLATAEQNKILQNRFDEWRGELEQIDDVCIIGIRI